MKRFVLSLMFLFVCAASVYTQQHQHQAEAKDETKAETRPAALLAGLGDLHHPVSTKNAEAQRFFDQGLTLVYAFNHEEAVRAFQRAAELDPQLAMAHWGVAYALGPNINLDVDPQRERAAYEATQKALALAKDAPENERAYVEALAKRYSVAPDADLKKLAVDFKNAMGELSRRYPDDLDAATLYAESAMNLRPWQLWTRDGKPAEGTGEIIAVLESVLRRNPNHIGAIHYYIHAVEASPDPGRALPYVAKLPAQVPAAGHLVHMPAHIYMRTGAYLAAARSNADAARADESYIRARGAQGVYPLMYYNHNVHFLAIAYSMAGRYDDSLRAARQLEANVAPYLREMPMLEGFTTVTPLVMVRFRRWDDILKSPPPAGTGGAALLSHFARGMAYAATGNAGEAEREQKLFAAGAEAIPADVMFGLNSAQSVLGIARDVLAARVATARGDNQTALALLRKAVEGEDALAYDEPPAWFIPVRESLGGLLLRTGRAAEAERVFRADLERNPRNGRSLFGLRESLRAQGKAAAARAAARDFDLAWKEADTRLRIEDL